MDQYLPAIYEGGVFRPLQPVNLPNLAKVQLQIREDRPAGAQASPDGEIALQQAALAELLAWLEQRPAAEEADVVSARDHDRLLYGWSK